ncbi:mechanosensitive ion channel protein 10-like [Humulus lupulus]|uniref:mechanosensitive ion channel protein 10-like n=1 Tax=Humulus lupulus TaxID=3486 RepID=UPI002B4016CC|nr:mechanosensitive ion channel protein 10-like [Humulus lupulus]
MEVAEESKKEQVVLTIDPPPPNTKAKPDNPKILRRLNYSKPRSRFEEFTHPLIPPNRISEYSQELRPQHHTTTSSSDEEDEDDDAEWYGEVYNDEDHDHYRKQQRRRKNKMNKRAVIEWSLFLIIMTCLICSLTLQPLKHKRQWSLEIWKWCLMIMVVFCGRLVSGWVVGFAVFLIERNFMLKEKVLYFVHGLRKSFQNCAWLALVLIAWMIMFPDVHKHHKFLKKVFLFLIAIFVGATIWLLKILVVKVLASSFHVATFFDRMKESVFHHYILDALSGPPMDEEDQTEETRLRRLKASKSMPARLREKKQGQGGSGRRRLDMDMLRKLSRQRRATAWSVRRLVSHVRSSGLSTISTMVDDFGNTESEITSEWEARNCAKRIFKHVAKTGAKYIEENDLLRFLKYEEVYTIFPLFEGSEGGKISKSSFRNWVVHAYVERKALAHSLNDTKTAVHQLHKLASAVVMVVITVVSLLVMGLATTKVVFVVTSQLLLVGFMFQNTCKTMFESIIFVFVMHPFDVGDRCVVDGVQMTVEEMNILTTVFLRYDNEKIYYPNSVLLTKPISNFRRSPDMADAVEFAIDFNTPLDDIVQLKKAIQTYIESKPKQWNPKHSVLVKEIENVNEMKMGLYVQHTMNHQNYGEKSSRRSELVFELKRIFQTLRIKYHLLPQEVRLTQFNMVPSPTSTNHI